MSTNVKAAPAQNVKTPINVPNFMITKLWLFCPSICLNLLEIDSLSVHFVREVPDATFDDQMADIYDYRIFSIYRPLYLVPFPFSASMILVS